MSSRKSAQHHKKKKKKHIRSSAEKKDKPPVKPVGIRKLELVLKCDTSGCAEAIISAISALSLPEVEISIISSGVGAVSKSDIFMAETGSRLIIGFNVGIMPHIEQMVSEHKIEIRLYDIIYKLIEEVESIAKSFIQQESSEQIIATAKIIALFKSTRKGIILGCEVLTGKLALGDSFRVLGAMGPKYTGTIVSLHIEENVVKEAAKGQQVGLKIKDFNRGKIGDLVESFRVTSAQRVQPWQPQGKIYYP